MANAKSSEALAPAKPKTVPTAEPSIEGTEASLLDELRSPAPSDPSRKRKLAVNIAGNRRRVSSNSKKSNEPVNVTASQRVQKFKDEAFFSKQ